MARAKGYRSNKVDEYTTRVFEGEYWDGFVVCKSEFIGKFAGYAIDKDTGKQFILVHHAGEDYCRNVVRKTLKGLEQDYHLRLAR